MADRGEDIEDEKRRGLLGAENTKNCTMQLQSSKIISHASSWKQTQSP